MQYNKTTLLVFLASISGFMTEICWSTTALAQAHPAEPAPFHTTTQEQVAAFLRNKVPVLIEEVLSDFPEDAYLILVEIKFYQQCKNPLKVMALLEEGLKYHPENFNLNNMAAKVAFTNGDYEKAILFGQKALAVNAKNPILHEDLADAMLFSGQYQQAVDVLDKKIAVFGGSERSYRLLGKGHSFLKDYEKARDYYEKADQINPGSTIADYSILSKIYMRLKQPEKAKEYMKLHSELTAHKKMQDLEDAKNKKDRVVLDSSDSEVLVFSKALARLCIRGRMLYLDKQKPEEAEKLFSNSEDIFNQSIGIAADTADLYREFANLYLSTGKNLPQALTLAQKGVTLEGSAENYYALGQAYSKNSDPQKAMSAFQRALEQEPRNMAIRRAYNSLKEKRPQ